MKSGKFSELFVTLYKKRIGVITKAGPGYAFEYLPATIPHPVSLSLSLLGDKKESSFLGKSYEALPHYFESMLPEGWLLDVARGITRESSSKLEILYLLCRDSFGAVSFETEHEEPFDLSTIKDLIDPDARAQSFELLFCQRCAERLPNRSFNGGFHEECALALFGVPYPPTINVSRQDLKRVAEEQLLRGQSLTGAQEKFSLTYKLRDKTINVPGFTYIVKPRQSIAEISDLPRTEQLMMIFAKRLGLVPADSAVIRLRDGTDAFLTKRFDRDAATGERIHAEDFSQASGVLRGGEGRYQGSHELLAKILDSSYGPKGSDLKEDRKRLLGLALMNFLFGNSDGHLKNHAILWTDKRDAWRFRLSPFYDLVPCRAYTKDDDELGLKLCGKNRGLTMEHFETWASERLDLGRSDIEDFLSKVRSERSFILSSMRGFELAEDRIKLIMDLVAKGMKQLKHGTPEPVKKGSSNETYLAGHYDESKRKTSSKPPAKQNTKGRQAGELCAAGSKCKNENGPTRLRVYSPTGFCSYCDPERTKKETFL